MKNLKSWYQSLDRYGRKRTFWILIACMLVEVGLIIWNIGSIWWWSIAIPAVGLVAIFVMFVKALRRWKQWDEQEAERRARFDRDDWY